MVLLIRKVEKGKPINWVGVGYNGFKEDMERWLLGKLQLANLEIV
jgi:hypothetical protein